MDRQARIEREFFKKPFANVMVSITAQKPMFLAAGALRKKVNPFSKVIVGLVALQWHPSRLALLGEGFCFY